MSRIIAMVNHKGGTGKSTCTFQIGLGLALKHKKKVLLVDCDPQGNLSTALGIDTEGKGTLYDIVIGTCSAKDAIIHINDLVDVIPSDIVLSRGEMELIGRMGREFAFKTALKNVVEEYDYVLLDCPPSLGILAFNALVAANEVFIVMTPEYFSAAGIRLLNISMKDVNLDMFNPNLRVTGVIINMADQRKKLHEGVITAVKNKFGSAVFETMIRNSVAVAESVGAHKSIYEYKSGNGNIDFTNLLREIVKQEEAD